MVSIIDVKHMTTATNSLLNNRRPVESSVSHSTLCLRSKRRDPDQGMRFPSRQGRVCLCGAQQPVDFTLINQARMDGFACLLRELSCSSLCPNASSGLVNNVLR